MVLDASIYLLGYPVNTEFSNISHVENEIMNLSVFLNDYAEVYLRPHFTLSETAHKKCQICYSTADGSYSAHMV